MRILIYGQASDKVSACTHKSPSVLTKCVNQVSVSFLVCSFLYIGGCRGDRLSFLSFFSFLSQNLKFSFQKKVKIDRARAQTTHLFLQEYGILLQFRRRTGHSEATLRTVREHSEPSFVI